MDGLQSQLDNLAISPPTQEGSQRRANATMQAFFEIRVNLIRTAVQGALKELSLLRGACSETSMMDDINGSLTSHTARYSHREKIQNFLSQANNLKLENTDLLIECKFDFKEMSLIISAILREAVEVWQNYQNRLSEILFGKSRAAHQQTDEQDDEAESDSQQETSDVEETANMVDDMQIFD